MNDRILIIEDDDVVAYGLEAMLKSAGYVVDRRKELDASLAAGPPATADLVLLDILMSYGSRIPPGTETLLTKFKALSAAREIPILDISYRLGSSGKPSITGEPFLKKSFSREELLRVVDDTLAKNKALREKGMKSPIQRSAPGTNPSGAEVVEEEEMPKQGDSQNRGWLPVSMYQAWLRYSVKVMFGWLVLAVVLLPFVATGKIPGILFGRIGMLITLFLTFFNLHASRTCRNLAHGKS